MKNKLTNVVMLKPVKKQKLEFIIHHKIGCQPRLEVFDSIRELARGLHNYDFLCQMYSWDPYDDNCDVFAKQEMDALLNELEQKVILHGFEEYYVYSRYQRVYRKAFSRGIKAYSHGMPIENCDYLNNVYKDVWAEGWNYAKTHYEDTVSSIDFWGRGADETHAKKVSKFFMGKYEIALKIAS